MWKVVATHGEIELANVGVEASDSPGGVCHVAWNPISGGWQQWSIGNNNLAAGEAQLQDVLFENVLHSNLAQWPLQKFCELSETL